MRQIQNSSQGSSLGRGGFFENPQGLRDWHAYYIMAYRAVVEDGVSIAMLFGLARNSRIYEQLKEDGLSDYDISHNIVIRLPADGADLWGYYLQPSYRGPVPQPYMGSTEYEGPMYGMPTEDDALAAIDMELESHAIAVDEDLEDMIAFDDRHPIAVHTGFNLAPANHDNDGLDDAYLDYVFSLDNDVGTGNPGIGEDPDYGYGSDTIDVLYSIYNERSDHNDPRGASAPDSKIEPDGLYDNPVPVVRDAEATDLIADGDLAIGDSVELAVLPTRRNVASIGLVLYAPPDRYPTDMAMVSSYHIEVSYRDTLNAVAAYLNGRACLVKQILLGHEHGTKLKKCHYQMCVEFERNVNIVIKPQVITICGHELLMMAQTARNTHALKNYCKKEGDFHWLYEDKKVSMVYKKDKKGNNVGIDPFKTVLMNKTNLTVSDAKDLIFNGDTRTAFVSYNNIKNAIDGLIAPQLPEFEFSYPKHLLGRYPGIEEWFNKYCTPYSMLRRKALVLYSKARGLGKTMFAESLVNHPGYYVKFRNSFTPIPEGKDPKLVILDDMSGFTDMNKESWKALFVGQETAIRDCYYNVYWPYNVPCIVTTNNLFLITRLVSSPEFNTSAYYVEVRDYMGPPGTEVVDILDTHMYLDQETMDAIAKSNSNFKEKLKAKEEARRVPDLFIVKKDYNEYAAENRQTYLLEKLRKTELRNHELEERCKELERRLETDIKKMD